MKGIDVSQHNGVIDWNKTKKQIDFAIIRLGWIGNRDTKIDLQFERNYSECKRLGIPVGVYVFNYVTTPQRAKECASWVLDKLEGKELDLPVYIDMEDDENSSTKLSVLGKNMLTMIVQAFNGVIESKGLWAGVYANLNWFNNYLHKDELIKKYTTWIAHYGVNEERYRGQYDILQYTNNGQIAGMPTGRVDLDIMYRDLIQAIKSTKKPLKSNEQIADEVIHGHWGNGEERRKNLTNAGYNYDTIQKIVNNKLKAQEEKQAQERLYNHIADQVINGDWGNGDERRKKLMAAGYDYDTIQKIVNDKLK